MNRPWDGWSFGDLEAAEDAYQHGTVAPLERAVVETEGAAELARRAVEDALLDDRSLCRIHEINIRAGVSGAIEVCDGCLEPHYEHEWLAELERCGCGCGAYGDPRFKGPHAAKCLEPASPWRVTGCTCACCTLPAVTSPDTGTADDGAGGNP